jgi:hypothetical protein
MLEKRRVVTGSKQGKEKEKMETSRAPGVAISHKEEGDGIILSERYPLYI